MSYTPWSYPSGTVIAEDFAIRRVVDIYLAYLQKRGVEPSSSSGRPGAGYGGFRRWLKESHNKGKDCAEVQYLLRWLESQELTGLVLWDKVCKMYGWEFRLKLPSREAVVAPAALNYIPPGLLSDIQQRYVTYQLSPKHEGLSFSLWLNMTDPDFFQWIHQQGFWSMIVNESPLTYKEPLQAESHDVNRISRRDTRPQRPR